MSQRLELDLAIDEVDDAALLLDALGLALEHDRHGDRQHLVHRDLVEVGVEQPVIDRVELIFLDQDAGIAGRGHALEPNQRVDAGLRVQDLRQRLWIDGNLQRFALLCAVEYRRYAPARAQPPRLVLASSFPGLELQCCSSHRSYQPSAISSQLAREPKAYVFPNLPMLRRTSPLRADS